MERVYAAEVEKGKDDNKRSSTVRSKDRPQPPGPILTPPQVPPAPPKPRDMITRADTIHPAQEWLQKLGRTALGAESPHPALPGMLTVPLGSQVQQPPRE